jgi:hypothetical protein
MSNWISTCGGLIKSNITPTLGLIAIQVMDVLSQKLGSLGTIEGFYGSGGGPMHLFYFGRLNQGKNHPRSWNFSRMWSKLMINSFLPLSAVDATHQMMFLLCEYIVWFHYFPWSESVLYSLPPMMKKEILFLQERRILFVQPRFDMGLPCSVSAKWFPTCGSYWGTLRQAEDWYEKSPCLLSSIW